MICAGILPRMSAGPALPAASRNQLLSALAAGTASIRAPGHLRPFPSSSLRDCVHTGRTTHPRPSSWQCLCGVGPDGCTHVWICAERSSHTALPRVFLQELAWGAGE